MAEIRNTELSLLIILWAPAWLRDFMGNMDLPSTEYRCLLVIYAGINAVVSLLFEKVFVERFLLDYMERLAKRRRVEADYPDEQHSSVDGPLYERILSRIGGEPSWLVPRLPHIVIFIPISSSAILIVQAVSHSLFVHITRSILLIGVAGYSAESSALNKSAMTDWIIVDASLVTRRNALCLQLK
ncbi:unnamed protein product [Heligmosomoides polygyrus]|uniref:Pecanex-like protein n=1 Tax=Heligmosomoides polygyrus TaxID=6339 RepID=A0A183G239_HELPZ|nr:unnamed protein product [Heligmosomoides polygyrus]